MENRRINYFLPGDKEGKKTLSITIKKREQKWLNPKYVTIWGTYKADLDGVLTNAALTKLLEKYGTILEPVEDVFDLSENAWSIDQKKCRLDLDKELHVPRNCPIEVTTNEGTRKGTLRITYKDQPYYCRRCTGDHVGDCPKWLADRKREEEIREQKVTDTKTVIIGDSNLKLVNSNALLADVVSSSGAKIGHIGNQLSY